MSESWEKSYDILNEANDKISKNTKFLKTEMSLPDKLEKLKGVCRPFQFFDSSY
ncbi:MAG: hypothetical protein YK1312THETA_1370002 [Marine Group I thaumarchaeote]|nr:MAG: hypothetical protein YK1312THETA_1370002 [Marine Group I thaumarchaeote]